MFQLILRRMRPYIPLLFLLCVSSFLLFFRLGDTPLYSKDEGRYAEIPREMLASGDWITPRLNYVYYFEKPALSYWCTAASYALFGENEFAARFPVALMGLLTILAVYLFGRAFGGQAYGLISALILLMTPGFFLVSRFLVIDGPFTFFCTISLLLFWTGSMHRRTFCLLASYACMGAAVLTKGLIGLALPVMIVGSYMLIARDFGLLRRMRLGWGMAIFLAVSAPWFILVSIKNPTFFDFFFIREHFQRYLTNIAGREEPVYYFLIVGAVFFLPWTFFIPAAVRQAFTRKDTPLKKTLIFLNVWWMIIIVFFSLSRSKLPPYILPMTPPLALLVGLVWRDFLSEGTGWSGVKRGLIAFIAGIALLIPYVLWELLTSLSTDIDAPLVLPFAVPAILIFVLEAIALGWFVLYYGKKREGLAPRAKLFPFVALGMLFLTCYPMIILAMRSLEPAQSVRLLAREINKDTDRNSIVAVIGRYEHVSDIGFYVKRRVVLVGGRDAGEQTFGRYSADNNDYFLSFEAFRKLLQSGRKVYCIVSRKGYNEFAQANIPGIRVVKEIPKGVLIVNESAK